MHLAEARLLLSMIYNDRAVRLTVFLIIMGVLFLSTVYAATSGHPTSSLLSVINHKIGLGRERSMFETVNYGFEFMAFVLFFLVFVESRSRIYFSLSILMAFIWLDDSASYHERFGGYLAAEYDLPHLPGTQAQHTGELIAWALAGTVIACLFVFSFLKPQPGDRGTLILFSIGFLLLLACGMVADLAKPMAPDNLKLVFTVVEDGGEMLAVVLFAALALGLVRNFESYQLSAKQIHFGR